MARTRRFGMIGLNALLLAVVIGCSEEDITNVASLQENNELASDSEKTLGSLARATAHALSRPEVRQFIIEKMRRSPWNEHKITFREALMGPDNALRGQIAAEIGVNEDGIIRAVERLPEMDFYLPNRHYRQSWTSDGASPSVAASLDGRSYTRYDATGGEEALVEAAAATDMIFAIHPAEPRAHRIGRPAYVPGPVIEAADDGAGGIILEYTAADGRRIVLDLGLVDMTAADLGAYLAHNSLIASRAGEMGARSQSVAVGYTELSYFENDRINDGPFCCAEIEFKANKTPTGTDPLCCEVKLRWTDVGLFDTLVTDTTVPGHIACNSPQCSEVPLVLWSNWSPGIDAYTYAHGAVYETDAGDDDKYGVATWSSSQSGQGRVYWGSPDSCNPDGLPCAYGVLSF